MPHNLCMAERFTDMPSTARVYWFCVLAAGGLCFLLAFLSAPSGWPEQGSVAQLGAYLIAAIVASSLRIRLPGVQGKLSMNYAVILAALLNIGLPSAMIVAVLSTTAQCVIQAAESPRWFDVVFASVGVALPAYAADLMLHLQPLLRFDSTGSIALVAAALTWFLIDAVVSGPGRLPIGRRLPTCPTFHASLPYLLGASIAGAIHFMDGYLSGPALAISAVPLYLVYRYLGNQLVRVEEQKKHIAEMAELHVRTIETL